MVTEAGIAAEALSVATLKSPISGHEEPHQWPRETRASGQVGKTAAPLYRLRWATHRIGSGEGASKPDRKGADHRVAALVRRRAQESSGGQSPRHRPRDPGQVLGWPALRVEDPGYRCKPRHDGIHRFQTIEVQLFSRKPSAELRHRVLGLKTSPDRWSFQGKR